VAPKAATKAITNVNFFIMFYFFVFVFFILFYLKINYD
jgi:hypothetical protein